MSENKEKDFTERFNTLKDEALKAMRETTETVLKKLDTEKRKAEIRSEIGHNARELSKAYEKLGREYFLLKIRSIKELSQKQKQNHRQTTTTSTMDLILVNLLLNILSMSLQITMMV